jgi:FdhD protein
LCQNQPLQKLTGSAHAAAIFSNTAEFIAISEDIGRHNALDKAIGKVLLAKPNSTSHGLVLSGRVSFEMIAKAVKIGAELIIAVSAPSSLAIEMAEHWNITLCGFARDHKINIYTHPSRII